MRENECVCVEMQLPEVKPNVENERNRNFQNKQEKTVIETHQKATKRQKINKDERKRKRNET